ncbi:MAG: hypothetical protein KVP17_001111 [Porospora cf. gigantea B]|uniref:uncharacterized protein n=1 Tax=Porospora cf. gigantea B TaxID=2853592 RepID=UPI003571E0C3|nr:MAG: hypothetical protein KVP17_001111 [Porospora cf. gigantea B]
MVKAPKGTDDDYHLVQQRLDSILRNQRTLHKAADATFQQFDLDGNGTLDAGEVRQLLDALCKELTLPPVDDRILAGLMCKYDDGDGILTTDEFQGLYCDVLFRVRDKYYPSKKMRVRRRFFIESTEIGPTSSIDEYIEFIEKIGSGSFGEVHLVRLRGCDALRVVKIIRKDKVQVPVESINAEIEILKELDHPNIIKILDTYEDYNNVYIVMEYCQGGELMSTVLDLVRDDRALSEKACADIMLGVFGALACCHAQRIAHKDLKPENIMFTSKGPDAIVKVIDFGVAETFFDPDDTSAKAAGTALYMAPEVYLRRLNLKCDIWSAGCILYLILTARLPFLGRTLSEVKHEVLHREPKWQEDCSHLSDSAVDLLKKCLAKDQKRRPSAREVLGHPWFIHAKTRPVSKDIAQQIGVSLLRFMKRSETKTAIFNLLAHQLDISNGSIREICQLFYQLDADNSGTLSRKEVHTGLTASGWNSWDIQRVIQALDVDDSGEIQYNEFLAACVEWQDGQLQTIWSAFSKLDHDGNGKIDKDEFSRLLLGQELLPKKEVESLMADIDTNCDGTIDWDEFLSYVTRK